MTREPAIMLRPVRWRSVQNAIDAGPSNPKPAAIFPRPDTCLFKPEAL